MTHLSPARQGEKRQSCREPAAASEKAAKYTGHHWFACTNIYWGPNDGKDNRDRFCEYDIYVDCMDGYELGAQ